MHYSEDEKRHWSRLKDVIAPEGVVNPTMVKMYLDKCVGLSHANNRIDDNSMVVLGALLKHLDVDEMTEPFAALYEDMVSLEYTTKAKETSALEQWTIDMAQARPKDLERLLMHVVRASIPENQVESCPVLALESLHHHLPGVDLDICLPPAWMVSSPDLGDSNILPSNRLDRVATLGARLLNDARRSHRQIGDALVLLAFFNVCTEPSLKAPGYESVQTNVQEAFAFLEKHVPGRDASQYFDRIRIVTSDSNAIWDGLGHCAHVLSTITQASSRNTAQALAQSILQEPLDASSRSDTYWHRLATWLASIHAHAGQDTQEAIEDWMHQRIHSRDSFFEVGAGALIENGPLFEHLAARMQTSQNPDDWCKMLVPLALGVYTIHEDGLQLNHSNEKVLTFFTARIPPSQVQVVLKMGIDQIRQSGSGQSDFGRWMHWLGQAPWSSEQVNAVRQCGVAATLSLWYLYEQQNWFHEDNDCGLPQIQWQPFPFLQKMYPEHAMHWSAMQCELAGQPLKNEENSSQHSRIWQSIFERTASLLEWPMALQNATSIVEGLGVSPSEYFLNHLNATNAASEPFLALPQDLVQPSPSW